MLKTTAVRLVACCVGEDHRRAGAVGVDAVEIVLAANVHLVNHSSAKGDAADDLVLRRVGEGDGISAVGVNAVEVIPGAVGSSINYPPAGGWCR